VTDPAHAGAFVARAAAGRRDRDHCHSVDQVGRATELRADLGPAATRHSIGPDHWGQTTHPARAAGSGPSRRPPGSRPRLRRWRHRRPVDR
jgi:hypothetical protein